MISWRMVRTNTPGGLMTTAASGRKPSSFPQPQMEWTPILQLRFVVGLVPIKILFIDLSPEFNQLSYR